jgi:hypothetical protein
MGIRYRGMFRVNKPGALLGWQREVLRQTIDSGFRVTSSETGTLSNDGIDSSRQKGKGKQGVSKGYDANIHAK